MPYKRKRDNGSTENEQLSETERKRRRVLMHLQSDLTDKMTTVKLSPNGLPTSRFGRVICSPESRNSTPELRNNTSESRVICSPELRVICSPESQVICSPESKVICSPESRTSSFGRTIRSPHKRRSYLMSLNRRKIHKIHSFHHCEFNPNLRLISREEINSKNSIVDKLINVTKQGLNDDNSQFQTLPSVVSDECNFNSIDTALVDNEDFEVNLPINVVGPFGVAKSNNQLDASETDIVDMIIDLTDQSDIFDSVNSNENLNCARIVSTKPMDSRSDSTVEIVECISKSTSTPSSMIFNDSISVDVERDPVSMEIVTNDNENMVSEMNNNLNDFKIGDIVWAAAAGYRFWPAMVWKSGDESYVEDGELHVRFFCDGRFSWVNIKNSILPYQGREEYLAKLESGKRKGRRSGQRKDKKWDTSKHRKWDLAILEADVMINVDISFRVSVYENIFKGFVLSTQNKQRKSLNDLSIRCDSPQTTDTAYSSMKQSVSPASINPPFGELNENIDVTANIDKYFELMTESEPVYEDSLISCSSTHDSLSSVDSVAHSTVESVFNQIHQNCVCEKDGLQLALQSLWQELYRTKPLTKPVLLKRKRVDSIESCSSTSTGISRKLTKRQSILDEKKKRQEKTAEIYANQRNEIIPNKKPKISTEMRKLEHMREVEECFLKRHPANYLLKGLAKEQVCEVCLLGNKVYKCGGQCNGYYHLRCIDAPSNTLEQTYGSIIKSRRISIDSTRQSISTSHATQQTNKKCYRCLKIEQRECFVCKNYDDDCIKCSEKSCSNIYHKGCLQFWPKPEKSSSCSRHICHTCKKMPSNNLPVKNLMKCLLCPATYHRNSFCIPAGCQLLSESQLICGRHYDACESKIIRRINVNYCLICGFGGALVCCDTCPYAFHEKCLNIALGDTYICEGCESGERPLNGDIVWAKYGSSCWWPAVVVPPPRIPETVEKTRTNPHQICVKFFGAYTYGFVMPMRVYLYDKGDTDYTLSERKEQQESLRVAIHEAGIAMELKCSLEGETKHTPKPYKRISANRYISKLQNLDEPNICTCTPANPCSSANQCLNMSLFIECDPQTCPAMDKCQNQVFRRGVKFQTEVKWVEEKGFGLIALERIPADSLIVEYVGDVIDHDEFIRRYNLSLANKDEHYYFLGFGNGTYIDAGPAGNDARFINHSCEPNAQPTKWNVQQQKHIGIFAQKDILPGEEITFNYSWGTAKNTLEESRQTICRCGTKKCRGFM